MPYADLQVFLPNPKTPLLALRFFLTVFVVVAERAADILFTLFASVPLRLARPISFTRLTAVNSVLGHV